MKISQKFRIQLLLSDTPQYRLAVSAGIHPNTLSKMVHGAVPVQCEDKRILKIAEMLGLKPEEVFEQESL